MGGGARTPPNPYSALTAQRPKSGFMAKPAYPAVREQCSEGQDHSRATAATGKSVERFLVGSLALRSARRLRAALAKNRQKSGPDEVGVATRRNIVNVVTRSFRKTYDAIIVCRRRAMGEIWTPNANNESKRQT